MKKVTELKLIAQYVQNNWYITNHFNEPVELQTLFDFYDIYFPLEGFDSYGVQFVRGSSPSVGCYLIKYKNCNTISITLTNVHKLFTFDYD